MTSPADAGRFVGPTSLYVFTDWLPLTGTDGAVNLRAIRATGVGNVVVKMSGGSTNRTLEFLAGETRYGVFTEIVSATATGLEGGV